MKHVRIFLMVFLALGLLLSCTQGIAQNAQKRKIATQSLKKQIAQKGRASTVLLVAKDDRDDIIIGSGFFVRPDLIATNIHVIASLNINLKLVEPKTWDSDTFKKWYYAERRLRSGTWYNIEGIAALHPDHDLAILKVTASGVQPLLLGNSNEIQTGEPLCAVGNPLKEKSIVEGEVARGKILGFYGENSAKLIRMSAKTPPGYSGGPVLNSKGEVIGVAVRGSGEEINWSPAIPSKNLNWLLDRFDKQLETTIPLSEMSRNPRILFYRHMKRGGKHMNRGDKHIKRSDKSMAMAEYKKADEAYTNAIDHIPHNAKPNPDYIDVYNRLGMAKLHQGNCEGTISVYNEAIKLNLHTAFTYNNLGLAYKKMGDKMNNPPAKIRYYKKAINACTEAINRDSDPTYQYFKVRGLTYLVLGDTEKIDTVRKQNYYEKAVNDFTEAIERAPADSDGYRDRAKAKSRLMIEALKANNKGDAHIYSRERISDLTKVWEIEKEKGDQRSLIDFIRDETGLTLPFLD